MGQSFSAQSGPEGSTRQGARFSSLPQQRESNGSDHREDQEEGEQSLLSSDNVRTGNAGSSRLRSMATFRRHISTHTLPTAGVGSTPGRDVAPSNEVVLEQEERPLVSMEDLRMPDARITDIRASPMPRRSSLWRLGSRVSRRYSTIGPVREEDHSRDIVIEQSSTHAETDNIVAPRRNRHSMLATLPSLFSSTSDSPRRRMPPISGPIPFPEEPISSYDFIGRDVQNTPVPQQAQDGLTTHATTTNRRDSRATRVRRSLSGSIDHVFGNTQRQRLRDDTDNGNRRLSRLEMTEESPPDETEYLLPPISIADTNLNLEDSRAESSNAINNAPRHATLSERTERPRSWASRLADSVPHPRREGRGINLLRGRSSRLIRRDDEAPLSRILQVAAAAIAAQLSGSPNALANIESVGNDNFDGSLNNFVEELNTAADSATNTGTSNSSTTVSGTPLNFWRVFRFVSPGEEQPATNSEADAAEPRTVTLVVVGVRSVPSSSIPREGNGESGLDSLLGGGLDRTPSGGLLRGLTRTRFGRRSSIANPNPFPNQYDSQRHHRNRLSRYSGTPSLFGGADDPTNLLRRSRTLSDSNGIGSSTIEANPATSQASTPSLTQATFGSTSNISDRNPERIDRSRSPHRLDDSPSGTTIQQRRRSASDSVRHRNLGSGASRRNGTIDPDGGPVQGRSWLIYVVGTNLPEDHPAFTAPGLFTDNPSYEDLLLLSNILGPVKPPVASDNDVAASGGRFRLAIREDNGNLRGTGIDDSSAEVIVLSTERCQICLEDYALEQELRQLSKCTHTFHQQCVDEWLTTGRNSCPLCRGQGVTETTQAANAA